MDKKMVLTAAGFAAALALGIFAGLYYVDSVQERDRDALQRVMSEQFARFDTDSDQFLSKAELENFARSSYESMVRGDETPAQQDRTEFIALYKKNANNGQGAPAVEHNAQTTFDHADLNGDSLLTADEYAAFYMKGLAKMGWPDFDARGVALITGPRAPSGN